MKLLIKLIAIAALTGCTQTTINRKADGALTINRLSLFQKLQIPDATVSSNGTFTLKGYANDGGQASAALLLKAAALAAKESK